MKNHILVILLLVLSGCGRDQELLDILFANSSEVELLFPLNNSECTTGRVISDSESEITFEWSEAQQADRYKLILTNLISNEELLFETQENTQNVTLNRGMPYSWAIESIIDETNTVTKSMTSVFYNAGPQIESFIPFPAFAISPVDNSSVTNTATISLEWTAEDLDNDITGFDIYFGETSPPPLTQENELTASLTDIVVNSNTTYFWRIITKDQSGNQSSSEIFSFTISD